MDAKGRTFAFKATNDPEMWMVLVFVQGKKGVQRRYKLHLKKNHTGKYRAYCNCPKAWYGDGHCHHEDEFYKYMEKLLEQGKARGVDNKIG